MKTIKIGWIGLGNMGAPMAMNFLKAGFDLAVYNRTAEKAQPIADKGALICKSEEELCMQSDAIFTSLTDDKAVSAVYEKLLSLDVCGKLFVNMSTISPALALALAETCKSKGAGYMDSPVAGSIKPAVDGTLLILASGNKVDYERALPFLNKLGRLVFYLGAVGQGSKAKLAINYYISVTITGIAETVLFAESNGIVREQIMEIINESAVGSAMSHLKTPSIIANDFPPAFALINMLKDVNLAKQQGLATPMSDTIVNAFQKAVDDGNGKMDFMAVIRSMK